MYGFAAASGKINESRVGIGTSVPQYNLHLGSPGTGRTDIYVTNEAFFAGQLIAHDVKVSGALTCTNPYRLYSTSQGYVTAGVVTAYSTLQVGDSAAKFTVTGDQCGIGPASP